MKPQSPYTEEQQRHIDFAAQFNLDPFHITQVIVVRNDIRQKMRYGKLSAQVSHASMAAFNSGAKVVTKDNGEIVYEVPLTDPVKQVWIECAFAKVVLKCDDEDHLMAVTEKAKLAGLPTALITDAGRTVFNEPTPTCVGIGPVTIESLEGITDDLKLY